MTSTPIEDFNRKECELIDALKVNAYTDLRLDPDNDTGIILDTSWGEVKVDLASVVKAGETITRLYLAPETGEPEGLCYEKEDGTTDYITGDELSRIVSMHLLKDVDQSTTPVDGDVYMYDGTDSLFKTYALKAKIAELTDLVNGVAEALATLQDQISNLQSQINSLSARVLALERKTTPPSDAPSNAVIAFGNINLYSDPDYTGSNTLNKNRGLYTHTLSSSVTGDEVFS